MTTELPAPQSIDGGILAALRTPLDEELQPHFLRSMSEDLVVELREILTALGSTQRTNNPRGSFAESVGKLRQFFLDEPSVPLTLLYRPRALLDSLARGQDELSASVNFRHPVQRWCLLAAIAESLWLHLNEQRGESPLPPTALLVAARLRFVVLSEPFRRRGLTDAPWTRNSVGVHSDSEHGLLNGVFGAGSWPKLVARSREARDTWLGYLDSYESVPSLRAVAANTLEEELHLLAFDGADGTHPLRISDRPLTERVPPEPADTTIVHHIATRHLLPRFALRTVWRIVFSTIPRKVLGAITVSGALVSPLLSLLCSPLAGAFVAAAAYVLGVAATGPFGRIWTIPWLLRIPAAGTLGLFLLLALPSYWWENASWSPVTAIGTGGLLVAPALYLLIQATNHNVGKRTVPRVGCVLVVAAVHAWLITLIGLTFLMPIFADNGHDFLLALKSSWQTQLAILLPAAAFNFSVGVFTQILWEDRPITAPLAHASWNESR